MPGTVTLLNGSINIASGRQALAAAGKTYIWTNPTPGTAIAYVNATSFSATANGFLLMQNKNPTGGPTIYLDRLTYIQTATAPTATFQRFEAFAETGLVTATGNVATRTPVNLNPGFASTTGALCQSFAAGAMTIPAAVGTRTQVWVGSCVTGVPVVQDTVTIDFGADGHAVAKTALTAAKATDPGQFVVSAPALEIAPQTTLWLNLWGPATNVPSFEWSFTYNEL